MNRIYIQIVILTALIGLMLGCSSKDKSEADTLMHFTVVDSLLGETLRYEEAGQIIKIPAGYVQLPDSIRKIAQRTTQFLSDDSTGSVQVYLNQSRGSGMVVSVLTDLALHSDTGKFLSEYYEALVEMHHDGEITVGDYWVNDVLVKNFLVTDSQSVMFDLICVSQNRNAMHVQFLVPKQFYAEMIQSLESSIGSISTIR